MIYVYVFTLAFAGVGVEMLYRYSQYSFWALYPLVFIIQIPLTYSIYKIVTMADQYLEVLVLFPLGSMTVRLLAGVLILGERPPVSIGVAIGLVMLANFIRIAYKYKLLGG